MSVFPSREKLYNAYLPSDDNATKISGNPSISFTVKVYAHRLSREEEFIQGQEMPGLVAHVNDAVNGPLIVSGTILENQETGAKYKVEGPPRYNETFNRYTCILKHYNV